MKPITKEEQKKLNEFNAINPCRTTTVLNWDGSINTGVAAERVDLDETVDGSTALKKPTGVMKQKFDEIDSRTLSGTNWDKIDVTSIFG